ncbi:hypothetical protein FRX31_019908, partial [Thalictrum thalictroides]
MQLDDHQTINHAAHKSQDLSQTTTISETLLLTDPTSTPSMSLSIQSTPSKSTNLVNYTNSSSDLISIHVAYAKHLPLISSTSTPTFPIPISSLLTGNDSSVSVLSSAEIGHQVTQQLSASSNLIPSNPIITNSIHNVSNPESDSQQFKDLHKAKNPAFQFQAKPTTTSSSSDTLHTSKPKISNSSNSPFNSNHTTPTSHTHINPLTNPTKFLQRKLISRLLPKSMQKPSSLSSNIILPSKLNIDTVVVVSCDPPSPRKPAVKRSRQDEDVSIKKKNVETKRQKVYSEEEVAMDSLNSSSENEGTFDMDNESSDTANSVPDQIEPGEQARKRGIVGDQISAVQ